MCQNCGVVMIASYDRQRSHDRIGFSYCDKECMYQDKGRIYRTSESYQQKRQEWLIKTHGRQSWAKKVCKIYHRECSFCKRVFSARRQDAPLLCSEACRKQHSALVEWIASRRTQIPREVPCAGCGVAFTALTRTRCETKFWCGEACRIRHHRKQAKHTRRERIKVCNGVVRGDVSLHAQHKKYNGKCQICGRKVVMANSHQENMATVDHVVPLSKGGLHVEENLQLACWKCNTEKSDTITKDRQLLLY
jgi:5-methylcytosine-specific restriction endonuclease McrA